MMESTKEVRETNIRDIYKLPFDDDRQNPDNKKGLYFLIIFNMFVVFLMLCEFKYSSSDSANHHYFLHFKYEEPVKENYTLIENHEFTFEGKSQKSVDLIKTIKAVAGDRLEVLNNKIFINNIEVGHYNLEKQNLYNLQQIENQIIPEGYYFVLGKDEDSFDSRYKEFGLVRETNIRGKVVGIW